MNTTLELLSALLFSALGFYAADRLWTWRMKRREQQWRKEFRDAEAAADKYIRYLR